VTDWAGPKQGQGEKEGMEEKGERKEEKTFSLIEGKELMN